MRIRELEACNNLDTVNRIKKCAVKEFADKGFRGASLRNIVKSAGVTTGAFYGYYKSKEDLFEDLVDKHADFIMNQFIQAIYNFEKLPDEEKTENMSVQSDIYFHEVLDYAYEHIDEVRLLLCSSDGTKYENFINDMIEKEISSTHDFYNVLENMGYAAINLDPFFEHVIVSGMISSFFETIVHDMPKERAKKCVEDLHRFYTIAWSGLMGLK